MPARLFGLIPAAGAGSRAAAEVPKQYLDIAGRPMLAHAVRALLGHARIDTVFVVLAPDDHRFAAIDWGDYADRVAPLYCGGATRRDSVFNGLVAISNVLEPEDWVLVHDAARPCLDAPELTRLIDEAAADAVGGILGVPLADTLKRADAACRIEATAPRAGLWQAQTPQMFRHGTLLEALGAVGEVTDEAGAVEQLGLRPRLVAGSPGNLKVTFPGDLALAALLLAGKQTVPGESGQ